VDTRQAAQRWAEVWERGWPEHDVAGISALYAEGAFWQQDPFRNPEPGHLARVFAEEESAECRLGVPIVDGDQAAVPWSAQTRLTDGGTEDLAGCRCSVSMPTGLSWRKATSGTIADASSDGWSCCKAAPTSRHERMSRTRLRQDFMRPGQFPLLAGHTGLVVPQRADHSMNARQMLYGKPV
jgi:hypothetical protein